MQNNYEATTAIGNYFLKAFPIVNYSTHVHPVMQDYTFYTGTGHGSKAKQIGLM